MTPFCSRRRRVLATLAAAATLPAPTLLRAQGSLKIGLTLPLTGAPQATQARNTIISTAPDVGLDFLAGFQQGVAVEKRNLAIEVIELNDEYNPAKAAANVEALAQRDVVAVSGFWTAAHAAAALPVAARLKLPVVGMRSNSAEFRKADNPWAFHLKASDSDELAALVKTLLNMNLPRIGIVYQDEPRHRALLQQIQAAGASVSKAVAVNPADKDSLIAANREVITAPGTQCVLLLVPADAVVESMMELRGRGGSFVAPVVTLSDVISKAFAESRERALNGLGVASPFTNPALSRTEVAGRFRDALIDKDLDPLTKSFAAFEGFVYGSVIARTMVGMKAPITRDGLAAALRSRPLNLGGLPVKFDERQVGYQAVHLLYKFSVEGTLKS